MFKATIQSTDLELVEEVRWALSSASELSHKP